MIIQIDAKQTISVARFGDILRQSTRVGGCLLFNGYDPGNGYGRIEFKDQQIYVHRAVFAAVNNRPIRDGLFVCHSCDTRNCVEIDHLFEGTSADNNADMRAKNRGVAPPILRGEANPKAALSDEQVASLRLLMADGKTTQREAAALYQISQSTVWRITHKMTRST